MEKNFSIEWNMEENFSMEWNIEENCQYGMEYGMEDFWYGMEMEWKKIASMEYGKIVFHSIPYHALFSPSKPAECADGPHTKSLPLFFILYTVFV